MDAEQRTSPNRHSNVAAATIGTSVPTNPLQSLIDAREGLRQNVTSLQNLQSALTAFNSASARPLPTPPPCITVPPHEWLNYSSDELGTIMNAQIKALRAMHIRGNELAATITAAPRDIASIGQKITSDESAKAFGTMYGNLASLADESAVLRRTFHNQFEELERLGSVRVSAYLREHGYMSSSEMDGHYWKEYRKLHQARGFLGIAEFLGTKKFRDAQDSLTKFQTLKDTVTTFSSEIDALRLHIPSVPDTPQVSTVIKTFETYLESRSLSESKAAMAHMRTLDPIVLLSTLQRPLPDGNEARSNDDPQHILSRILGRYITAVAPANTDHWRLAEAKDFIHHELTSSQNQEAPPSFATLSYETRQLLHSLGPSTNHSIAHGVLNNLLSCAIAPELSDFRTVLEGLFAQPPKNRGTTLQASLYQSFNEAEALLQTWDKMKVFEYSPSLAALVAKDPEFESFAKLLERREDSPSLLIPDELAAGRAIMDDTVISTLLGRREHAPETVTLGHTLFGIKTPEALPYILINSIRETGVSGDRPFVANTHLGMSPLVQRATELDQADLSFLRRHPCSHLALAFNILREHKDQALRYYDKAADETYIPNPLREHFQQTFEQVLVYYLRYGTDLEKQFIGGAIRSLDFTITRELQSAVATALTTGNNNVKQELTRGIVSRCVSRHSKEDTAEIALAALTEYPRTNPFGDARTNTLAALFHGLPAELQVRDDVVATMANAFNVSPDVIREIPSARQSLETAGLEFEQCTEHRAGEQFRQLSRLAGVEGLAAAITTHYKAPAIALPEQAARIRITTEHIKYSHTHSFVPATSADQICHAFAILCSQNGLAESLDRNGFPADQRYQRVFATLWKLATIPHTLTFIAAEVDNDPRLAFHCLYAGSFSQNPAAILTSENIIHLKAIVPVGTGSQATLSRGLSLLADLGWMDPDLLPSVASAFPTLAREGGLSEDAWNSYRANLSGGSASFLTKSPEAITRELSTLLEFGREFPGTQAPLIYEAFRSIGTPQAETKLSELGLEHKDRRAIHELKLRIRSLRERALESERPLDLSSKLESELFNALIGYSGSPEILQQRAMTFEHSYTAGRVAALSPSFRDSRIAVDLIDSDKLRSFSFSEPTRARYKLFVDELTSLRSKTVAEVVASEREQVTKHLADLLLANETFLASHPSLPGGERKGREIEVQRTKQTLKALTNAVDLSDFIKALCEYRYKDNPVTVPPLRRLSLRLALDELQNDETFFATLSKEPTKESLESIVSLVTQHLKDEALPKHELSEKQSKVVHIAVGTSAFDDDFQRLAGIGSVGTEEILVHPTRGILGELSGFNCGACWDRESDIMARYPNVTALMFIRNPNDDARKRIVGACMIMTGQDTDGHTLLIVRGLNPTQNFITQIKAGSFFEQLIDNTLVPLALAHGATKIVIPGGGCGGAQTNRPSINDYVTQTYGSAPIVTIDPDGPNTIFNGYSIQNSCRLVRHL